MDAADVVAIVTAVATVFTVGISIFSLQTARTADRTARNADRHERMPVLISPRKSRTTIDVRNVGRGPAINIALAKGGEELAARDARSISFDELLRTSWSDHKHLQPMEPGEKRQYEWVIHSVAGLSYTDALGHPYTTLLSEFGTHVFEGNAMPELRFNDIDYADRHSEPDSA
jgi:hypothetical protein